MKRRTFNAITSLLVIFVFLAPSVFLALPQKAHALGGVGDTVVVVGGPGDFASIKNSVESTIDVVKNTITSVASVTSAIANDALVVDKYVLEPIAFVVSGNLLKSITAGVIAFVDGKINGTGIPQFVQSLQGNLQEVSDVEAFAYFAQYGANSNSPFAASITSSLQQNYLQQTSLAGFFAQNQCTLGSYSPNVNAFLAGDWSQGGAAAWFALTTEEQNNPYMLYENSQDELSTIVANGTEARLQELSWGNGFLSWCGGAASSTAVVGSQAGDACTNSDGSPGTIETPGSVIEAELNKALGSETDVLTAMGNAAPEINSILGNIATVLNTVSFAQNILGGTASEFSSGGLAGVITGTPGTSELDQYTNSSPLGVTEPSIIQGSETATQATTTMANNIAQYQASWNTIGAAAQNASTTVTTLENSCPSQASAAQSALQNEIAPVLNQQITANQTIANAQAMITQVDNDAASTDAGAGGAYTSDLQTLETMSPTATDVANAQQQATSFGDAAASPQGSLNVSASSYLDQMNLINSNAQTLETSIYCSTTPDEYGVGGLGL